MDNSELVHLKLNTTSNLSSNPSVHPKAQKPPILGVGDILGAGDSYLLVDFLLAELADDAFENLQREVRWQNMYHRGVNSTSSRSCFNVNEGPIPFRWRCAQTRGC